MSNWRERQANRLSTIGLDEYGHPIVRAPDGKAPLPAWVSPTGERVLVRWRNFAPGNRDAAFERVARQIAKARPELRAYWAITSSRATTFLRHNGWHRSGMQATAIDALPYDADRDSAV